MIIDVASNSLFPQFDPGPPLDQSKDPLKPGPIAAPVEGTRLNPAIDFEPLIADQLTLSETLLPTVLETIADDILIINHTGKILFSNQRLPEHQYLFEAMFNPGDDRFSVACLRLHLKNAEDLAALGAAEYAQPEQATQSLLEFIDGRVFERHSQPYYRQGVPVGRVINCRDVTSQRSTEAPLKHAAQRLAWYAQQTLVAVIEYDPAFYIVDWNAAAEKIFGFSRAEAIGQNVIAFIVPEPLQPQIRQILRDSGNRKTSAVSINENCTKSGRVVTCKWCSTPLVDASGQVIGYTCLAQDVTAQVQAPAELTRNNALLETLVAARTAELQALNQQLTDKTIERQNEGNQDESIAIVSHELRTSLTAIYGALNLLNNDRVKIYSDRGRRFIQIAAENSVRLLRLVNNLLDLEKLESRQTSLSIAPYNLDELMLKATQHMQVMADQAGVTLITKPLALRLNVDADRIIQVLLNLLSNAIKFSPSGKTIWLTATPVMDEQQSWIILQVRDQAMGIAPEQLEKIFDRFYQANIATGRSKGGVGLGLTICRNIVHQHGGNIWAESVVGQGTCFYVKLPV